MVVNQRPYLSPPQAAHQDDLTSFIRLIGWVGENIHFDGSCTAQVPVVAPELRSLKERGDEV
jgi:hypothetical protein